MEKLIIASRGTGKTELLINECSKHKYAIIVCPNARMCDYTYKMAADMGIKIPKPITFNDFVKGNFDSAHIDNFFFDELQLSLSNMSGGVPIDTVVIGSETFESVYLVGTTKSYKEKLHD